MNSQETDEVEAAVRSFYAAIEDMIEGRGLAKMEAVWDHSTVVTGKHPMGEWCLGWEEVLATWQVVEHFGRPGNGGSELVSTRIHRFGELAYATSVFRASPSWGGEMMLCTNILRNVDGAWKVIHHHADPSPKMFEALQGMAAAT